MHHSATLFITLLIVTVVHAPAVLAEPDDGSQFFERSVRPILIAHCYECHSEESNTREGGLLLDRESGWLEGGDSGKAVIPGSPEASLLLTAVDYSDDDLQMPPDGMLGERDIGILQEWVRSGAPGPKTDLGATGFSRLGDQSWLSEQAKTHWAFQPVGRNDPPQVDAPAWNRNGIDRLVYQSLAEHSLRPSRRASDRILLRRLSYDLTGLPPTIDAVKEFEKAAAQSRPTAISNIVDELLASPAFGEQVARMWLDVARYADTDSTYRPDTRTPQYFPFAFTYRDYVVDSFNSDKPIDQFIKEQLAGDLMGFDSSAPETAALGFLTTGPHAKRSASEAIDDWIDLTTRGLMGLTVACARCHDHKYEPVPTADYYALHGIFASVKRIDQLDEKRQPLLAHYNPDPKDVADYQRKRAAIDKKITDAAGKKNKGNNRPVSQKIRETELAELLLFHPGAPAHTMVVEETGKPVDSFIAIRGETSNRGERISRRFLSVLDADHSLFPKDNSGRLALAERITDTRNPLTARVFVNRIWGMLIGSYLVQTPSDFGLQGAHPTHPELLDWLTTEFVNNGWSLKHLVKMIVQSGTYQQQSDYLAEFATVDPGNRLLWRANRKHLSIEALRDSILCVSGQLDRTVGGRCSPLWNKEYSKRRAIYGYVNRFNLDPTLRAFDFPSRMQTHPRRGESIVSPQALFAMNSPFVIDQSVAITRLPEFVSAENDEQRIIAIFEAVYQRPPASPEISRISRLVEQQHRFFEAPLRSSSVTSPWPLATQALLMSNEFQYVD